MNEKYTIVNPQGFQTAKKSKVPEVNPFIGLKGSKVTLFSNCKPNVNILFQEIEAYLINNCEPSDVNRVEKLSAAVKTPEDILFKAAGAADCAIVAMCD